ncbi:HEAT repeat domain-containing protein [Streptomyces sp. TRM68416]|uniref:HEAT repeat domain-containing protein n=1 Tax=Streptomyces sp. TRM68416 TaxID=2758412 RepID=UPI00166199C3|nr:HEAT repeat domain-containing protein [Streptomyces sp. TRM68416]MBD0840596.1 HEAT repeat domain-containing protein [Streptomyces sp. TRM68416]
MFTGIDEVDWASMHHAYGSAENVPGLLRGLASADPAERECALDGMYGAVHHQGDVYDSTLACVPFLFALAARPDVQDRGGIVELLVSIGGEEDGDGAYAQARAAVRARADVFAELAGDADLGVRRAAPKALVRFLPEPARVLGLLQERIRVERDDRVLITLTESLGLFARRYPAHADAAVDLLAAQSAPPYGPGLRLAALGRLADCAPDRLPADLVPTAVRLLRERSARRSPEVCEPVGAGTDTLVGRLRRLRPSDEEGSHLLRTLHTALDDRVDDRIALLVGQLSSPDSTDRCNAVWMSGALFREWRADYGEPVGLIGAQLAAEEDRLREAAVSVLQDLFGLAAPAADHLHALVGSRPDLWVRRWEGGPPTLGAPVRALARSGDPRAVPVLARLLEGPDAPDDLGREVVHLGPAAAPLAPALRRRLGAVALDSPDVSRLAPPLLLALRALGDAQAVPEVLRLLTHPRPHDAPTGYAVRALGAFGPAAREAAPALRALLDSEYAAAAAGALWAVEGDASVVLPVLLREASSTDAGRRRRAAEELGRLGPPARAALPALRRMTGAEWLWERTAAACALWRVSGDAEPVIPVLRSAWAENPHTRPTIAACLASLGPASHPLHDLAQAELTTPRRHTAQPGAHGGHESPKRDEELLERCRAALAAS